MSPAETGNPKIFKNHLEGLAVNTHPPQFLTSDQLASPKLMTPGPEPRTQGMKPKSLRLILISGPTPEDHLTRTFFKIH